MPFSHSFDNVTPFPRFAIPPATVATPWVSVIPEQASLATPTVFVALPAQPWPIDLTPETPNVVDVTVDTATLAAGVFRFRWIDANGVSSSASPAVISPSTGPAGLDLVVLKRYLGIQGVESDVLLTDVLGGVYAFALRYTGLSAGKPLSADFADAMYVHAARNYRERDAMYADQVALTDDGAVVNYFRSMPPRVKAVYDMVKVLSPAEAYMS